MDPNARSRFGIRLRTDRCHSLRPSEFQRLPAFRLVATRPLVVKLSYFIKCFPATTASATAHFHAAPRIFTLFEWFERAVCLPAIGMTLELVIALPPRI